MPTVLTPRSAKRSAAGWCPCASIRKYWSSMPPSSASVRFSMTATGLAGGSMNTSSIWSPSRSLAATTAGNSWVSASPGETARILPSRSLAVSMPVSASEMMPKPEVLSSDITALIGAPWAAPSIRLPASAMPKVSPLAATTWTARPEPRPSLIVRSIPSSA